MQTKRSPKGWSITLQDGLVLWYSDATLKAYAYAPDDDPGGVADGEYCPRQHMLVTCVAADRVLRSSERTGARRVAGDFGPSLRRARLAAALTQGQVAGLIGRHKNTVARWERGEVRPEPLVQEAVLARL